MIDDLIEKNILSPAFADACWIIRQMGNSAAHADKTTIYAYQVDQVIEYVSTIINYLYSMPFRVSKLKKKVEEEKEAEKKRKKRVFKCVFVTVFPSQKIIFWVKPYALFLV